MKSITLTPEHVQKRTADDAMNAIALHVVGSQL